MAKSERSLIGVLLWIVSAALCHAAAAGEQKPTGTKVSAVWLGQAANVELHASVGQEPPVPLAVGSASRGKPTFLPLKGAASIKLSVKRAAEGAANSIATVGDVKLPASSSGGILLVLHAPANGNQIQGIALADDPTAFPAGTARLANFTETALSMKWDTKVIALNQGLSAGFPYPVGGDPKSKNTPSFPFALARGQTIFFNGRMDARPNSRTLVLISNSPVAGGAPVVQLLVDTPPSKSP